MSDNQNDNQLTQLTKAVQAIGGRLDSMDKKFDSIDKRFDSIDKRFDTMDKKFDGRTDTLEKKFDGKIDALEKKFDDQFAKLFKYMGKEFKEIHQQLDEKATKAELNTYANAVDAYMKRTETYHQEMLVLGHKVDRHEKWHHQTAKAGGVKLSA
jgi:peptidoglycan hydrolase CwlO-like protein